MKSFSFLSIVLAVACCLASCSPKENSESETNDSTVVSNQGVALDFSGLPENFASFLSKFPAIPLPAKFPSDTATYSEGDPTEIDEASKKEFLGEPIFDNDPDHLYYLASLNIHPRLFSVLVLQIANMGSPSYVLVNYNGDGKIISSRLLVYSEGADSKTSWSTAEMEANGRVTISDFEKGRTSGSKDENRSAYRITPAGAILPTGIPSELITTFHSATKKKGEHLIAPLYNSSGESFSNSFELRQSGDSIIFSPNLYFFMFDTPEDYDLIVDSYTKTRLGYQFTLKDIYNKHSQYSTLMHLTLNSEKDKPGAYQLVFSESEAAHGVLMGIKSEYVIAQDKLSSYKTRKLPLVNAMNSISPSGGLHMLWLGSSKDHDVSDWGKQHHLTYKREEGPGEAEPTVYHRLYDDKNQLAVEAIANPRTSDLQQMSLYSSLLKTDGGVGVGSTVGELLYAHEGVSAINGEEGVIVSIDAYKHTYFILDHIAGVPDSDLDIEKLDEKLKISRVDFRLD